MKRECSGTRAAPNLDGIKQVNSDAFLINIEDMIDKGWQQLIDADGIIFGSPTFMGGVAGQYKVFLDCPEQRSNGYRA